MNKESRNTCRLKRSVLSLAIGTAMFAGSAAADVKIGALMPLTGGLQAYGESCLNGVKMAADEVNASGGIGGEMVEVVVGDTQTKAQPSIDAAKKLASVSGVAGMVGALSSGNTGPVARSVSAVDEVPLISPASTAPSLTNLEDNDFLFRTVPSDAFQGVGLAQLVNEKGVKSVAVMFINNDYGEGLSNSFERAFTGMGGKVTASEAFEPNKASYRGELSNAAKGDPEALLLIAYPDDGGITILKQSLEEGVFSNFIFTDGMKAEKVVEQIGAQYLNGAYGTSPKAQETAAGDAFKMNYEKAYGELPPRPFIDSSYDAAAILMLAIAKAGSSDGKAVQKAIREVSNPPGDQVKPGELAKALEMIAAGKDIDYVGAAGEQDFDNNGDVAGTFEHWEIQEGQLVTISLFAPK